MSHENNVDRWPTGSPLLVQVKYYIDSRLNGGGGGDPGLAQRVAALEALTSTQATQIDTLTQQNSDQAGQISSAQADISALESTTASQAGQIAALEQQNSDQAGQISQAQQDITDLTTTQNTHTGQIQDLDDRVTALEDAPAAVQEEAIYVWDGGSYNVPDDPIDGVIVRHFYGPNPYPGDPWPGVLDVYEFAETVA